MCGIIGFSGPKGDNFDLTKIKTLIYINSIERGLDATGLFSPLNGIKKTLQEGWKFVLDPKNDIKLDNFLMAHVRAKTVGANMLSNTHPFERGDCILLHNGTIKNHWALLRKYNLEWSAYDVDSDVIAGCIDKTHSLDILKEIDGPAALIIHDKTRPNRMYVFRNKDRPLFKGFIGNSMYISSIPEALYLIECINVKEFKEDVLYTIEDGLLVGTGKKIKNNPYKEPIRSNTTNVHNIDFKKAIGCNIKLNHDFKGYSLDYKSRFIVDFQKDNYYEVSDAPTMYNLVIIDPITDLKANVHVNLIDKGDIIQDGDYVIAINDIYHTKDSINTKIINRGSALKVSSSFNDGELTIKTLKLPANYNPTETVFIKKYNFYKLTEEEYKEQLAINLSISINNDLQTDVGTANDIINFIEQQDNITVTSVEPIILLSASDNNSDNSSDNFERYKSMQPTVDKVDNILNNYFEDTDLKLRDLKLIIENTMYSAKESIELIEELINTSFKTYSKIYPFKKVENAN